MKYKSLVPEVISIFIFVIIVGFIVFFAQRSERNEKIILAQPPIIIPNVEEFLIHEPGRITVYSLNQLTKRLEPDEFRGAYDIFRDVIPGEKSYAKKFYKKIHRNPEIVMEIHLNQSVQINGGGWDHGKFGRGQTSVIR